MSVLHHFSLELCQRMCLEWIISIRIGAAVRCRQFYDLTDAVVLTVVVICCVQLRIVPWSCIMSGEAVSGSYSAVL